MKDRFWHRLLLSIGTFAAGFLICGIFCIATGTKVEAQEDALLNACNVSGGTFDYNNWTCSLPDGTQAAYTDEGTCWSLGGSYDYNGGFCYYWPSYGTAAYSYASDDQTCWNNGGTFDYNTWTCSYAPAYSTNYSYVSEDQQCWNNGGTFDYASWYCNYTPAYTTYTANYVSEDQQCWNNGGTFDYANWYCNYTPAYTTYTTSYVSEDQQCWNNGGTFDYSSWSCSYAPARSYSYNDYSYSTGYSGGTTYVGNSNTHKFHYAWCNSVYDMKDSHKVFGDDRNYFISLGYKPCKRCNP